MNTRQPQHALSARRHALMCVALLVFSSGAMAASKSAKAGKANIEEGFYLHVAVKGDTLSGIAHRYFENKRDWKRLHKYNEVADPNRLPIGKEIRVPQSAMRAERSGAEVIAIKGAPTANGELIAAGARLREGDALATPSDGFVSIRLADGSVLKVQSQSAVKLERARILANTGGVSDAVLGVQSGRIETEVNKQQRGARYEVRTPSSNMGVRGTVFRASSSVDGAKSSSEVVEGLVSVAGQGGPAVGSAVQLSAGFGTLIEAGQAPSAPIALLPAPTITAGIVRMESDAPTLTVKAVAGAAGYRAQLARDAAFNEVLATSGSASPTLAFAPLATGNYRLRVRAIDARGLEGFDLSAEVRVWPTSPKMVAGAGVTIEPKDGVRVASPSPRFSWDAVPGVTAYRLQIGSDQAFSKLVLDQTISSNSVVMPKALSPGEYFWRVASIDAGDTAGFSPVSKFAVGGDPLRLMVPRVDGAEVGFRWDGDGSGDAELVIATDERFLHIVQTLRVKDGTHRLNDLPRGHYFVRIRARFGERAGDWSLFEPFSVYVSGARGKAGGDSK